MTRKKIDVLCNRPWTAAEVEYLFSNGTGTRPWMKAAAVLGRSRRAIENKARLMGVKAGLETALKRQLKKRAKDAAHRIRNMPLAPDELDRKLIQFVVHYGCDMAVEEFGIEPETAKSLAAARP